MKFARVNPLVLLASVVWRKPFKPVFSFLNLLELSTIVQMVKKSNRYIVCQ